MKHEQAKVIRCAIYCRKSSEENLDNDFNSLDSQREYCEAFIKSQGALGYLCLPERFDDGGYSGGTLNRPAFKRLMAEVDAGRIDCIVVYKYERLSRSLRDFLNLMEVMAAAPWRTNLRPTDHRQSTQWKDRVLQAIAEVKTQRHHRSIAQNRATCETDDRCGECRKARQAPRRSHSILPQHRRVVHLERHALETR